MKFQKEKKNDRNNIFRDNGSELFKNQSTVVNTHLRNHANHKGDKKKRKENDTKKRYNKKLKIKDREIFHSSLNKTDYVLKNNYTDK